MNILQLKKFFELLKAKQKPYEDALLSAMQDKVDWIKKTSGYDLNQRQRALLEQDKVLVTCTETYIAIQHQIITHLFEKLEQAQLECAAHLFDKHQTEQTLRDYLEKQNGKIQSAA